MTNLKYVDLFLNAFGSKFFDEFQIGEFELHFWDQCFEGEDIHGIYDERISLVAVHDNKAPYAAAELSGNISGS